MVLVTGATGLVGSFLLFELLKKEDRVRALRRKNSNTKLLKNVFHLYANDPEEELGRIDWVEGDISDVFSLEDTMNGISDVYHCAALMSFDPKDHRYMLRINASGTANVINAALKSGIRKLCHVSSIAALGRPENNKDIINERLVWKSSRNNSVYSISKYESEREVWRGIAEGLEAVIVNPSVILGYAGGDSGSSRIFSTAWKNTLFYPPGVNGFVDVRDVVSAMAHLMENDNKNERFILSAENLTYKRLFQLMSDEYKKPGPKYKVGSFPASLAWRSERVRSWITGSSPLLTRETARTACKKHYYSSEKIMKIAGFEFRSIEETIAHHCRNFLNYKKGLH
jgi:nucleoside-diphosphate-sugar epimerase